MTSAHVNAIDNARIVGDFYPEEPDRYLADIEVPQEKFVFVAEVTLDGTVTFSRQAPAWLTGNLTARLATRVREARVNAERSMEESAMLVAARRALVMVGVVLDSGNRRGGQVAWMATAGGRAQRPRLAH